VLVPLDRVGAIPRPGAGAAVEGGCRAAEPRRRRVGGRKTDSSVTIGTEEFTIFVSPSSCKI